MLFWIIKQVAISLVIIVLIHYLYIFLKNNLTVPKVKDLVNRPEQKYQEIYKSLNERSNERLNDPLKVVSASPKKPPDMKTELKNYFRGLKPETIPASDNNMFNSKYETL